MNTENRCVFGPIVHSNIEEGRKLTREIYEASLAEKEKKIAEIREVYKEVDALLTPTMPIMIHNASASALNLTFSK